MVLALIALVVILILAVKGISDPFMAVLAFVVAIELQPGELYPPFAILHPERLLVVFILILIWMKKIQLRYPPITKKFLWFYGVMLLSTVFAIWRSNSIQFDLSFLEIVIYHLLLVSVLNSEERIRKYLIIYAGLVVWIGASALFEYHMGVRVFTMNIERAEGLTSAGGDPDTMATTMVIWMPIALLLARRGASKWMKIYGIAVFTIYLITIIDTGSRTAFLAFLVFLTITVFRTRTNWKFIPIVALSLPLLWYVIPQQYKARYETVKTRDQDESYTNRLLSWQGGVQMFLHNPLTGIGPDDYTEANGTQYWPGQPRHWLNAHSLYFKLLGELGILGVLTFFAYLIAVIRMNWRLARRFKREHIDPIVGRFPSACNISLVLLLFTGYSAHNTYRSAWYTLGAITAALALLNPSVTSATSSASGRSKPQPAWTPVRKSPETETAVAI